MQSAGSKHGNTAENMGQRDVITNVYFQIQFPKSAQ